MRLPRRRLRPDALQAERRKAHCYQARQRRIPLDRNHTAAATPELRIPRPLPGGEAASGQAISICLAAV
jgi:hypothetical protein